MRCQSKAAKKNLYRMIAQLDNEVAIQKDAERLYVYYVMKMTHYRPDMMTESNPGCKYCSNL